MSRSGKPNPPAVVATLELHDAFSAAVPERIDALPLVGPDVNRDRCMGECPAVWW
jgi:hypothetical protein